MALEEVGSLFKRKSRERKSRDGAEPARGAASPPPKTVMIDRGNEGMTMRLVDRLLAVKLPLIGDKPVKPEELIEKIAALG